MEWTTTLPTASGWFWFRRTSDAEPECVGVHVEDRSTLVNTVGWDDARDIGGRRFNPGVGQWAGPIVPPK